MLIANHIRSLFAVDLKQHDIQRLITLLQPLKQYRYPNIRWLPEAGLHITLCFLGEIPLSLLPELTMAAKQLLDSNLSFSLDFNELQYFPTTTKPKVIALLPQQQEPLQQLAQLTKQAARQCGLTTETHLYRPHLSVARINNPKAALPILTTITSISDITISKVSLFQSAGHSRYIPLANFPLIAHES